MISNTTTNLSSKIVKPTSTISNSTANLLLASAGTGIIIMDSENPESNYNNNLLVTKEKTGNLIIDEKKEMSLLEFSRLYKIGQIPIMDFVMIYILLYVLNSICLKYDYKYILIATIPLVILLNLITNKSLKMNWFLLVIVLGSIYLLFSI